MEDAQPICSWPFRVLAFVCAFHPLSWSLLTINLAWDTLWKSTGASELVHAAAQCWEGSADKQEALLPSGGLLFLVSHALRGKVAENQLSCQKRQKSFLWTMWLLYLFILLIYHTLVTSLIFLNLTNRLPRTQSIWLSSANKLFAMCLLSKKTCCPQVTILKRILSTCFIN